MEYIKYLESLPKKRMSAGALFLTENGKLLLLKPTYKETWLIPGGVIEKDESPKEACEREVFEEIGLKILVERLLVVSYGRAKHEKNESLRLIFFGGVLSEELIGKIKIDKKEISAFSFCKIGEAGKYLGKSLNERVMEGIKAYNNNTTVYIEE